MPVASSTKQSGGGTKIRLFEPAEPPHGVVGVTEVLQGLPGTGQVVELAALLRLADRPLHGALPPWAFVLHAPILTRSVGEEGQQVGPGEHADRLAVLDDEDGVALLQLVPRRADGFARTDEG